jgi:hypothetical protein
MASLQRPAVVGQLLPKRIKTKSKKRSIAKTQIKGIAKTIIQTLP